MSRWDVESQGRHFEETLQRVLDEMQPKDYSQWLECVDVTILSFVVQVIARFSWFLVGTQNFQVMICVLNVQIQSVTMQFWRIPLLSINIGLGVLQDKKR